MTFRNRLEAADILSEQLKEYRVPDTVIYSIPRGGTIIASRVAERLHAPIDIVLVRKIGHPDQEEYAIAAVSETGDLAVNEEEVRRVDPEWFKQAVKLAQAEAIRRHQTYLREIPRLSEHRGVAILVDDGMATGLTVEAAVLSLKQRLNQQERIKIVVAAPVASESAVARLAPLVDRVIVLEPPARFGDSVGAHYLEFPQVNDDEVQSALARAGELW